MTASLSPAKAYVDNSIVRGAVVRVGIAIKDSGGGHPIQPSLVKTLCFKIEGVALAA